MSSLHSNGFSLCLSSCVHFLDSNFLNSTRPPFNFRVNISNIYGTNIITIATIFTIFFKDFMTNKARWFAMNTVMNLSSN